MALFGTPTGETRPASTKEATVLKPYEVEQNGVTTTLMLSDADAKARGLVEVVKKPAAKKGAEPAAKKADAPANKAVTAPANK